MGLELLDSINAAKAQNAQTTESNTTGASASTGASAGANTVANTSQLSSQTLPSTPQPEAPPAQSNTGKPRATARTLIFKKGMSADGLDPTYEQLTPGGVDPAASNLGVGQNSTTSTGTNPVIGQNPTTSTGTNPAIGQNASTATGANPTYVNPALGPNLAAAVSAANAAANAAATGQTTGAGQPPVGGQADDAITRHNSNVIPAHAANPGGRAIARTMILKSLAPPAEADPIDLQEEPLTEAGQTYIPSATEDSSPSGPDPTASSDKLKFVKRKPTPTLTFKAFTMPAVEGDAKPAPLKIVRYDSSKLRNLESSVKPLSIGEGIAAAKQAHQDAVHNKDDRRPLWLKTIAAHPYAKSPIVRSGVLLAVLSIVLLLCSSTLIKSLYTQSDDYHPSAISTLRDQHHYKSTDGAKSLAISDKDTVLTVNGKAIHGKIKTVSDADLISLVMAPPAKREIWFNRTDAGFVDQDGTILYGSGAPELQIAKKIDDYAALLTARYKEAKTYPSDPEKFEHISPKDFHYTNPFTGKVDQPIVQYKRFAAADASWTDHTRQGHAWADEVPWKPGAIHCICLDYCRLFMRGYDRDGHPLVGAVPGVADYVELKDGNNMNPRRTDKVVDDKDRTPATFMVARNSGLQFEVGVLRQLGPLLPVLLVVLVLMGVGWILFLRRMKNNKVDSTANTSKFATKE